MSRIRSFVLLLLATAFIPAAVSAQSPAAPTAPATSATPQPSATTSAPKGGPRVELTATAMRRFAQTADSTTIQRGQPTNLGKPMALMIVGGAAILLGAIIGRRVGDVFMIAGAASLLVGLYQYFK